MSRFPFAKEAVKSLFKSPVTRKYPVVSVETPEKYRGKIKFNAEVCIGCGLCIRVCSPSAIVKTIKPVDGGQEITMSFDMGSCTFCGYCSDFCPKNAIELTQDYSLVCTDKNDLIVSGTFIKKLPPKKKVPVKPQKG
jgi:formate hydrogenlyase subunit 6/NADH:ubiquinone oxidoreductase subunit I